MRILIVDDDPDFRSLAARAMRREFADADLVEAGDRAGLDGAVTSRHPVDLLISDLNLNWADGFEVLAKVRAASPLCPAIMFTGTGNEEVAVRAIKAGFDDYVVKSPKQLRHLAASASAAVRRAEARSRLEASRDLLIKELYHRLHNNLQLVVGLIAFTARDIGEPVARAKLDDLGRRVQALSLLQEKLYRGGDFGRVDLGAFLRQLATELVALDGRGITAEVEADVPPLRMDQAVPLALIASELVKKAIEHRKLIDASEPLRITLRCESGGPCIFEVEDGATAPAPVGEGLPEGGDELGMRLVRRLAGQIGATVECRSGENSGRSCRITVRRPALGA
jgi:two-component sensor histidine kinase